MNRWVVSIVFGIALFCGACGARERWEGACADEAVLVATTSGSPNGFTCWNKAHRMRVQVATTPSNEEAAALVFCECVHEEKK